MSSWRRDAASGLVVVAPVLVTLYIIYWVFSNIASFGPLQAVSNPVLRVGLAVVIFVLVVFAVGYLMRTALGRYLEDLLDEAMNRLPGLRIVYNASKMAVETALNGTEEFQKPVKVETWNGMRMTAFRTGQQARDGREMLFIPTSPNITTGFVVEVESEDLIEVDETAEDALTRVLSAGFGSTEEPDVESYLGEEAGGADGDASEDAATADADENPADADTPDGDPQAERT